MTNFYTYPDHVEDEPGIHRAGHAPASCRESGFPALRLLRRFRPSSPRCTAARASLSVTLSKGTLSKGPTAARHPMCRAVIFLLESIPFATHRKSDTICDMKRPLKAVRSARHLNERLRDKPKSPPLIGYMRVSKADGSQVLDLQRDALLAAGVTERHIYSDTASGSKDERPGLANCLQSLREGDTLVVWKLDRLGRNLRHLINTVHDLTTGGIGLRVLTGQGAAIDTTTAAGKLVFGIFAALAEFERELITERTRAGLASARARGRVGGRKPKMTAANSGLRWQAWASRYQRRRALRRVGDHRQTLYRHVAPDGSLRSVGRKALGT